MLESLKIHNFQKHKELSIVFDQNVTSIVGDTGSGKTSILRAIKWVCLNRPAGEAFIRHGSKETRIELCLEKSWVIRKRGKKNLYRLNGAKYEAMGTSVPEDITKLLNVDEVNFQGQHDSPYWFFRTSGDVAKELNAIVNLDVIDTILGIVASELRKSRSEVAVSEERLQTAEILKGKYEWSSKADKDLAKLEKAFAAVKDKEERAARLKELLRTAMAAKKAKDRTGEICSVGEVALKLVERFEQKRKQAEKLRIEIEILENRERIMCQRKAKSVMLSENLRKVVARGCPLCGSSNLSRMM